VITTADRTLNKLNQDQGDDDDENERVSGSSRQTSDFGKVFGRIVVAEQRIRRDTESVCGCDDDRCPGTASRDRKSRWKETNDGERCSGKS
jgi:hypothetical protein